MKDSKGNYTDLLRRVYFRPYRRGMGPTFTLKMWALSATDWRGQTLIEYEFSQHDGPRTSGKARKTSLLFQGADFAGSPMHADDSDATVAALMGFITLRLGDTDRDYFDNYTPEQLAFSETHAETLACEVISRFGEN